MKVVSPDRAAASRRLASACTAPVAFLTALAVIVSSPAAPSSAAGTIQMHVSSAASIVAGSAIDGTSDTGGIDVTHADLGASFPSGFFVAPPPAALTRHPWISLRTQTSVLIAWRTDVPATGEVLYGTTPFQWQQAAHAGTIVDHAVGLTDLSPGTLYHYRIVSGTDTLSSGSDSFRTAPDTDEPYRFVAFGDLGTATPEQIELAARIEALDPAFGILTGDIVYENGEADNFTPYYFDVYRSTIRRVPFYPSLGNHDTYTLNGQPYLDAFHLPSNNPAGTERYYSFDYADAHFVALDVTFENTAPNAAMRAWLDADLAATTQRWKFVFLHVPLYSNPGAHGGDPTIAAALAPILEQRGVDIVFQGHNHYYTRTYPIANGAATNLSQEPDYTDPGAPIYIVTGGGGRFLHPLLAPEPFEVYSKSTFHTTVVDVQASSLLLRAIERDGTVIDSMSLTKTSTAVAVSEFRAAAHPDGVLLRWRASPAADRVVFHVYRALAPEAPAVRLNAGPAGVAGGPDYAFLDRTAEHGVTYAYRLGLVEDGREAPATGWIAGARGGPYRFALGRPQPNPSRGAAVIPLALDHNARVEVRIFDLTGRLVRRIDAGTRGAGPQAVRWDGRDASGRPAASGIYFAQVTAGTHRDRTRFVLLR